MRVLSENPVQRKYTWKSREPVLTPPERPCAQSCYIQVARRLRPVRFEFFDRLRERLPHAPPELLVIGLRLASSWARPRDHILHGNVSNVRLDVDMTGNMHTPRH